MAKHQKLRARIVEKYGTCSNFAKALNSSKQSVSGFLNGKHGIPTKTLERWAGALDIQVKDYGPYFFDK